MQIYAIGVPRVRTDWKRVAVYQYNWILYVTIKADRNAVGFVFKNTYTKESSIRAYQA